jgi:hypothetical protein
LPSIAASSPIGPAPVTSTRSGAKYARAPMRSIWSHALATIEVGSISIPTGSSAESSLTAYSASTVQRSEP